MGEYIINHVRALWQQLAARAPKLALALAIIVVFILLAKAMRVFVRRIVGRKTDGQASDVVHLAASSTEIALIFAGIITALGTIGVDVSALVAALGLTGFALGFALKDALSSLLAGCLILVYRPFRSGDTIAVAGCEGTVTDINLRYTTIETNEKRFLVPNSALYTNTISITRS